MADVNYMFCFLLICGSATLCWSQGGMGLFGGMGMDMMGGIGGGGGWANMGGAGGWGNMGGGGFGRGMNSAHFEMLNNAVKEIVGAHANPNSEIISYATRQRGPPRTLMDMMPYVRMFQALGDSVGVAGVPERPKLPTTGNITMAEAIKLLQPTPSPRDVVMSRAIKWFNRYQNQLASAPAPAQDWMNQNQIGTGGMFF